MRHNQNRRSRGRNNRKGPNPLTRSFESNGPDVKIRGTASHIADKYTTLARDAQASGDPVSAENYLQHAEHYIRIVMAAQAQFQQSQPQFREGGPDEGGYDEDRQMNGRPRDRFEFNGDGRQGDEDGDERFDGGEGGDDDRFRPPMQSRPHEQDQRPRGPRPDRFDRNDRNDRRDRGERYDRGDRQDYRGGGDGGQRQERFQRAEEKEQVVESSPPENAPAAPISDEQASPPRRRRGRPRGDEQQAAEGDDATPDGAAALAAFPDR
jgi:hypothetical protein